MLYTFLFDGSESDPGMNMTIESVRNMQVEYGALEAQEDTDKELPDMTWSEVKDKVEDGAYVKLAAQYRTAEGEYLPVYSYLYKEMINTDAFIIAEGEDSSSLGKFSGAWFEGRYYNEKNVIEYGTTFEESLEEHNPVLVFRNFKITLPELGEGESYYYSGNWNYHYQISESGVCEGYVPFRYNKESDSWIAAYLSNAIKHKYADGTVENLDKSLYMDQITLTREQVMQMNLDYNRNVNPEEYYSYDGITEPGEWIQDE